MTPTQVQLEACFLLPTEVSPLTSRIKIEHNTLIVECSTKREATQLKNSTYRPLLNAIAPKQEATPIRSVRYRWGMGRLDGWELPLYFTE